MKHLICRVAAGLSIAVLAAGGAPAADNAAVVIQEHSQRSTPWGVYRSERHTRVFGPESGFRYEEYRAEPEHPRSLALPRAYRHGRVIEHFGPGHRRAEPVVQDFGGHARSPVEPAIKPAEHLIQPSERRDGD